MSPSVVTGTWVCIFPVRDVENVDGNPEVNAYVSLEKVAVKSSISLCDSYVSPLMVSIYLGVKKGYLKEQCVEVIQT